ncbi:MAG TPA: DUF5668 domain-containing protein, partial [Povalibacter sp.]|nr:DUF5668 domain-containing protein [Povalibacter sp.]
MSDDPFKHQPGGQSGDPPGDQPTRRDPLFLTRLLVGIWVIALGGIFLLGNLGWLDTHRAFRVFWPVLMMLIGTSMVVQPANPRTHRWGWVLIGVGAWIFLDKIGWLNVSFWQLAFPMLLLGLGGMLVWRALSGRKLEIEIPEAVEDHAEYVRAFAVLSGTELRPVSRP